MRCSYFSEFLRCTIVPSAILESSLKKESLIPLFLVLFSLNITSQNPFITVWNTEEVGITYPNQFLFNAEGDYHWQWKELANPANLASGTSSGITLFLVPSPGIYELTITPSGDTPFHRYFLRDDNWDGDFGKLIGLTQWGDVQWSSFQNAFSGAVNLEITATDIPNLNNVTNMASAFSSYSYPSIPNLENWDVSNVTNMEYLFWYAQNFNQNIGNWNVSNVTTMKYMFANAMHFNQNIANWDVSNVTDMEALFQNAMAFNQNIGNWDVSNVTNMRSMFEFAFDFNQEIGNWDVSNVTDMSLMFLGAILFNREISNWNVGNVTTMENMFKYVKNFNHNIGSWDVSKVTDMRSMFVGANAFNQDIGNWNVSNVKNTTHMFFSAKNFNQDISNWDVSSVTAMEGMFARAERFNQDIGNWDVSKVTEITAMFEDAKNFNQDLSRWDLTHIERSVAIFKGSGISCKNYSKALYGWANNPTTPAGLSLGTLIDPFENPLEYSPEAASARTYLKNQKNWIIEGDVPGNCSLSIDAANSSVISIYPNPLENIVYIEGLVGNESLMLIDVNGRELYYGNASSSITQLNLSEFANGIYFLHIQDEAGNSMTKKVVKN